MGTNVGYLDIEVKSYESVGENIADKTALGFSPARTALVAYTFFCVLANP
ncbi:MAG: hypothetical protein ACJ04P_09620 [Halioglobus sp.]